MNRIAVLGGGAWGTALSLILAKKGYNISLWVWDAAQADQIKSTRENPVLPGFVFPDNISIATAMPDAVNGSETVFFVVVSRGAADAAQELKSHLKPGVPIISATKGLDSDTGLTISQMLESEIGRNPILALSGPNLAGEVAKSVPTATVIASTDELAARSAQNLLMGPSLRVYTNSDIIGVELAGALKNVIAIAAGICDGLGFGDNTKAALLTRGLAEITRLGVKLGAKQSTFMGLAGIGDLMATCASPLSRNRRLGFGLGQGKSPDEAAREIGGVGQIAEGVPTTRAAYNLARRTETPMPITEQIHEVLFEGKSPQDALLDLMSREPKDEVW